MGGKGKEGRKGLDPYELTEMTLLYEASRGFSATAELLVLCVTVCVINDLAVLKSLTLFAAAPSCIQYLSTVMSRSFPALSISLLISACVLFCVGTPQMATMRSPAMTPCDAARPFGCTCINNKRCTDSRINEHHRSNISCIQTHCKSYNEFRHMLISATCILVV